MFWESIKGSTKKRKHLPIQNVNSQLQIVVNWIHSERIHTGEKPFACSKCNQSFADSGTLKKHESFHKGKRPFACSKLTIHSARVALKRSMKGFTKKRGHLPVPNVTSHLQIVVLWKRHEKIHTGEKPFACSKCDQSFADSDTLKEHERIHKGKRPFTCLKCEKTFSQSGSLREH